MLGSENVAPRRVFGWCFVFELLESLAFEKGRTLERSIIASGTAF